MASADTVLVIRPDGTASFVDWPADDEGRRAVVAAQVGPSTTMRRCGKGILGFAAESVAGRHEGTDVESVGDVPGEVPGDVPDEVNAFAAAAYAEQGVQLEAALHGPVLFARNPSKGSVVKPLTAAQAANLLVVTGARLV
jgi:hypothetical protein